MNLRPAPKHLVVATPTGYIIANSIEFI
uniref:Uncharacterized protein n=1 Tax=Rhizophora mucronata TaxID=61149 RepID=A0A2P2NFN5_RHIMU